MLDNQHIDESAKKKTEILLKEGHTCFIWPKKLKIFKDFDSALRYGKLKNILPGIRRYKDGVELYNSIGSYKTNELKLGVLLII